MAEPGSTAERRPLEERELALSDGGTLRYTFAPRSGAEDAASLVIGLHYGWKGDMPPRHGRDFMRVFLEPTFAGRDALLATPYCPERSWHHPRSEAAVLELLDHLLQEHRVDPERVVLAGYSLGGMGTWYLGARHPDRFVGGMAVAAAPVLYRREGERGSGLDEFRDLVERGIVPWHEGLRRFRLYVVHSKADELIPWRPVHRAVETLRRRGARVEFVGLDDVGHYDSRQYVDALRPFVRELLPEAGAEGGPGE